MDETRLERAKPAKVDFRLCTAVTLSDSIEAMYEEIEKEEDERRKHMVDKDDGHTSPVSVHIANSCT